MLSESDFADEASRAEHNVRGSDGLVRRTGHQADV